MMQKRVLVIKNYLREMNRCKLVINKYSKRILKAMIGVGEELILCKNKVRFGNWINWLKENFALSQKTATRYMNIYRRRNILADLYAHERISVRMLYLFVDCKQQHVIIIANKIRALIKQNEKISLSVIKQIIKEVIPSKQPKISGENIASGHSVTANLNDEMYQALEQICLANNMSFSLATRCALNEWIKKYQVEGNLKAA